MNFHLYQLPNRHKGSTVSIWNSEYEMCIGMFWHINIFCIIHHFFILQSAVTVTVPLFSLCPTGPNSLISLFLVIKPLCSADSNKPFLSNCLID